VVWLVDVVSDAHAEKISSRVELVVVPERVGVGSREFMINHEDESSGYGGLEAG